MPCYHPLKGYRSRKTTENGKRKIVFTPTEGYVDLPVSVPCGQCIGCRLERSRQWAIRCVHEASLHDENCFITLTYNDKYLPEDKGLNKKHFQDFMKRFRKRYPGRRIRYFHCGEYGEKNRRPHYHACIFGFDFWDKELWSEREGVKLYISQSLQTLWPFGFSTIGSVTFESAAYVARYIMKKVTGDQAEEHYKTINESTGEITSVIPEYTTMSRRPGIAGDWFEQYKTDVYPSDFVVIRGKKMKPPKFYDNRYEVEDPNAFEKLKMKRKKLANKRADDNTPERLAVKEKCKLSQIKSLKRPIEE